MNTNYRSSISAISLFFALSLTVLAAPGDLDPTFGNGGIVVTGGINPMYLNYASAMAIQSDGKIIAVGEGSNNTGNGYDFAVVRYNTDGSLDTSFGGTGIVLTPVGSSNDQAFSLTLQTDGKIVVAGASCGGVGTFCSGPGSFAVVRYNPDGSLDTSFNGTGKVRTSVGTSNSYALSVSVQEDGKIVAAGTGRSDSDDDFAVVRYNPDGSLDNTFNGTGIVITRVGSSYDRAFSVAVQNDGKIVAGGESANDTTGSSFALVRYLNDGRLDFTFRGTGIVKTSFGDDYSRARDIAIQWDGKIIAAGYNDYSNGDFTFVRYNTNGGLDNTFGISGKAIVPIGSSFDGANSIALQPDGKIVATGFSYYDIDSEIAVVRLNPNGSPDTTFNGTGLVITNTIGNSASSVALQADGKIVVAGGYDGDISRFVLVRYQGGPVTGKIAFTSDRQGYPEIYLMNNDGTGQTRLTNNTDIDSLPAISPDGRKIAYVSQPFFGSPNGSIKTMNVDGTNQTVLTSVTGVSLLNPWDDKRSLSWSPDGRRLAFDDEGEVFTIKVDGTERINLTKHPSHDSGPAWSPDGSLILFSSSRVGYWTLHTMDAADGSDVKVLASTPFSWDITPDWSPNGRSIVFVGVNEDFGPFLYTANPDGADRKFLSTTGIVGGFEVHKPKWSPDGRQILFHTWFYGGDCEIYSKNLETGLVSRLTNTVGKNYQASWQPRRPRVSTVVAGERTDQ